MIILATQTGYYNCNTMDNLNDLLNAGPLFATNNGMQMFRKIINLDRKFY